MKANPLTQEAFEPYGQVIEADGAFRLINEGLCRRHHDLLRLDIVDGQPGLSLFKAELRSLPYSLTLLERHPLGSQAFVPMDGADWLISVAPDDCGRPGAPELFRGKGHQVVNIGRGVWHGVLCPIGGSGLFAVIDRIGDGANLEEVVLADPVICTI